MQEALGVVEDAAAVGRKLGGVHRSHHVHTSTPLGEVTQAATDTLATPDTRHGRPQNNLHAEHSRRTRTNTHSLTPSVSHVRVHPSYPSFSGPSRVPSLDFGRSLSGSLYPSSPYPRLTLTPALALTLALSADLAPSTSRDPCRHTISSPVSLQGPGPRGVGSKTRGGSRVVMIAEYS